MTYLPPRPLVRATLVVACVAVIAGAIWLAARIAMAVLPVTAALVAALLLTALVRPVAGLLRAARLPDALAALLTLVLTIASVGGVVAWAVHRATSQRADLGSALQDSLDRLHDLVQRSPLPVNDRQWDKGVSQVGDALLGVLPGAASGAGLATQVLGSMLLAVVLWFFLLKDGPRMWEYWIARLPDGTAGPLDSAGRSAWEVLTRYVRGTTIVAAIDAAGIGAGMFVLGVPLAGSLTAVVFLSGFIPVVGAFASGVLAVSVTLVSLGPVKALVLLAVVVAVQQLEGNVLQPLIMGRTLELHPLAVILAVSLGTLVGAVLGALVAVPLVAVVHRVALDAEGIALTRRTA